jgi:broad specificity phosphatase PhoE
MNIYFLRHGESEMNAKNIHQTHESKLSLTGISQAEFVAKRFEHLSIDCIYASNYSRAHHTAQIIAHVLNKEIIIDPTLRELKRPTEIEGKYISDPTIKHIKDLIHTKVDDPNWHYSDEENMHDLMNRCLQFIETLKSLEYKNILVVSHGLTIRMIIMCMMFPKEIIPQQFDLFFRFMHMTNTGITICERKSNKEFRLLTWNDYAHLPR